MGFKKLKYTRFSLFARAVESLFSTIMLYGKHPKKPNIVFIWIPKTAGTSIYTFLNKHLSLIKLNEKKTIYSFPNYGPVTFDHYSYNSLRHAGIVSDRFDDDSYKFAIARCPYDRAVSLFYYLKQKQKINKDLCFEGFLNLVHKSRPPIGLYNSTGISQANPQCDWLIGNDNGIIVDDIFKLEELNLFLKTMEEKYKIRNAKIEKLNQSSQDESRAKLLQNSACIELIELIYARDFDVLGYKKKKD